ncbi:MAG: sporulation protein YqfC [Negativicutes bacterium]|nr:sporulation protein YqfC [Negativicutes bacterium]
MQRRRKGNLQVLAGLLEIPQDIVLDLPRVTMLGNKQVLVENHKGIIEYTDSLLRIRLNQGELVVVGENLVLGSLQPELLFIEGVISAVRYDH